MDFSKNRSQSEYHMIYIDFLKVLIEYFVTFEFYIYIYIDNTFRSVQTRTCSSFLFQLVAVDHLLTDFCLIFWFFSPSNQGSQKFLQMQKLVWQMQRNFHKSRSKVTFKLRLRFCSIFQDFIYKSRLKSSYRPVQTQTCSSFLLQLVPWTAPCFLFDILFILFLSPIRALLSIKKWWCFLCAC